MIKYQVHKNQLRVYLRNGGVLYFVVYISESNSRNRKAFYCKLLPFDIKELLRKRETSNSVAITLKEVPRSEGQKRYIVESFISHSKRQSASYEAEIPTFQELMMDKDKWNLEVFTSPDKIFEESLYLYRNHKDITNYHQAIMKINLESLSMSVNNLEIAIDDKVYYQDCKHSIDRNGVQKVKFGQCLEFIIRKDGKATVSFVPKGKLKEILQDAEFIKDMLKARTFRCGAFKSELFDMNYNGIDETIVYVKKIKKLFRKLHIDKEVDLTNNTEVMYSNFMLLYEGIVENKTVRCTIKDGEFIKSLNVYGAHIPVAFIKVGKGEWRVRDLFDIGDGKYTIGWKMPEYEGLKTTVYVLLDKESFIGLGKRNLETLKRCINDIEYNKLHGDRLLAMLLMMIMAYDKQRDEELWKAMKYVSNYLLKNDNSDLNMINYYLVLAKKGELSEKVKNKLNRRLEILGREPENNWLAMGLCILLNKRKEFEERFYSLTKKQQDEFKEFPIMKLNNMMNDKIKFRENG